MNDGTAIADAPGPAAELAAFACAASDSLWLGIEKCLDNNRGQVFVVDDAGRLQGRVTLEALRLAVRKGAHVGQATLADVMSQPALGATGGLEPLVDAGNRLTGIRAGNAQPFLPVAEPDLSHAELRNLLDAFLSSWISSSGDYLRTFEQRFAAQSGMAHGIATSNGTVSLQLALSALGIGEGDEVIVPDFTFAASASAVLHAGARPVLVDIDRDSWCISAQIIERAITPRTRAIMPVHVFGRPAPMSEIAALARARGLYVIEDCAEAHGASYDGRPVGSFSDIASFSFFANKIITTGEGGMCLTDNPDLASRMRQLRDHGMHPGRRYWHDEVGFNFRMTNLQAAIGCAQLDRMPELLAMRAGVHEMYKAAFAAVPGVSFPPPLPPCATPVVWFACASLPAARRQAAIEACRAADIDLRPFFNGLSSMPAYRRFARVCPNSLAVSAAGVNLPTSRKVTPQIAERIAGIVRSVL